MKGVTEEMQDYEGVNVIIIVRAASYNGKTNACFTTFTKNKRCHSQHLRQVKEDYDAIVNVETRIC